MSPYVVTRKEFSFKYGGEADMDSAKSFISNLDPDLILSISEFCSTFCRYGDAKWHHIVIWYKKRNPDFPITNPEDPTL